MALIHSLKNTLVNQPIAVVLLIVLIYASFFRTLIVTASLDLFKYPVLRRVYFFTTPGFLNFPFFAASLKNRYPLS
ncbi:hypothetical protein C4M75_18065 [Escherichia coli]|jgi:hypothetical protein|nr:hypothetical protein [Escherichia coli]EFO4228210.1 hypothetical protein [Escherichia coli]EGD8856552.1 hypothetical protein [Escherichia coli]EGE1109002.1 hypothetical protein [Escherichia coli]EGE1366009.1 hypothetical protein [Escherichia coli]